MLLRDRLLGSTFLRSPADAAAGGAGGGAAAAASTTPAASNATAAAAPAASQGGTAAAAKPEFQQAKSILDGVKPADDKAAAKPDDQAAKPAETAEQKTEREKKEATERQAKTDELLKSYDTALKLPEGLDPSQPAFADFKKVAAQHGLSADVAKSLVESVAPKLKEAVEAPYKTWGDLQEKWVGEIKADKEIGGANLDKNLGVIVSGIHSLFPDAKEAQAVKDALALTGAANNPWIAKTLFRAGKAFAEGTAVIGRTAPTAKPDLGSVFYPQMAKEQAT